MMISLIFKTSKPSVNFKLSLSQTQKIDIKSDNENKSNQNNDENTKNTIENTRNVLKNITKIDKMYKKRKRKRAFEYRKTLKISWRTR